ncbi:PREDICTED: protein dachsous [Ceratosolen solmsi marchali]|uniref:Protein dachsous n=1 Tax=Ceratosolen solmsi marchali TaxID=326594 RepID=A0AAJ6YR95_9HYME|nr:PREDICTED: protein dachsous [Ceratosolen solmsi marchali]
MIPIYYHMQYNMNWGLMLLILASWLFSRVSPERVRYLEISENAPPGTRIGFIDVDNPPFLIVPVPGSAVDSDLIIEQATGEIRTRIPLDRETRSSYNLVALLQNMRVIIKVLDENDNAPNFSVEYVNIEFPENAPRDSKRALPPARDPDLGSHSTQQYVIVAGNTDDIFRLVPHRGRDGVLYLDLQINGLLDREIQENYQLMVDALDGGSPPLHSQLRVNVTIQDVNDNPPIFEKSRYATSIPENTTIGTAVLTIHATDVDTGDNGHVKYFINRRQSDREEKFRVDPESGIIYVNKALDFESRELHELVVVARDCGVQPLETNVFVSVYVNDVNDNHPAITILFLSDDATPKISESAQPGEFVARISVNDPDSRATYSNATVTLNGGDGRFGLTIRDDVVYLVLLEQPLDREKKSLYELSVEATDAGTPPLRAVRTFQLMVTDINDNPPQFLKKNYEVHLLETSEPGTSVLRVNAKDADEGLNAQIRYSLLNSTWFTIDENSGLITTVSHVDCELNPAPLLIVVAADFGKPPLSGSTTVRVTVHDVNDNEPIFEKPMYNVSVQENLPMGHCFLKVIAIDPDCGINAMVNYTLEHSINSTEYFHVHSETGHICIKAVLDREIIDYYEFLVIATDRGGFSSTSIVRISVMDINDNGPVFQPRDYNVTLRIDDLINEPFVRCSASDADIGIFGQVIYGISFGNEAGIFRINRNSGEIYVTRPDQLITSTMYILNITATDAAGRKSDINASVQITIISVGKKFVSCNKPRYVISVKENVAQNTFIGSIKESTVNTLNHFYWVTDVSDLSLESSTGAISTKVTLDREIRDRYILNVEIRNDVSIGYCQVEVIVEDINDNPPSFRLNSVRISIAESHPLHVALYVAYAKDIDLIPTTPLRYVIGQNINQLFGIDDNSGEVFLTRQLDYETQHRHRLVISVFDGAGLSANLSLNIDVQDVNDNPPVFERNEYYVEVMEDIKINSQILQVTAVDLDTGNNARLSYRIDDTGPFEINSSNGWIILISELDRETLDRYTLTVLATDSGSPAVTASASVVISVLDDNDNEPHFEKDNYEYKLFENQPAGIFIGTVFAFDSDFGNNALLKYGIVQMNSSFTINPDTGEIKTRELLDREMKAVHELTLEARDQGRPSRTTRVSLKIIVMDVNDNTPEIIDPQSDMISVREEQPSGTEVTRVRAFDNDEGNNASITYTIVKDHDSNGYNFFNIDPISGMIKTKVILDHEECNMYRLSIKASDAGRPERYSVRILQVEVLALTDNRPTFTTSSLIFNVREDTRIGESVGSISGTGTTGRITYTIDLLRPLGVIPAFDVDRITGQLVVAYSLDRENISEYHLTIRALDTTLIGNPQSIAVSVKVNIEDVNDNSPRWGQDLIVIKVSERALVGSIVYNFIATDFDDGINGDLRYSLAAEYPQTGSFAIDSLTGALTIIQPLDYEECSEYILVFKAEDQALIMERLASTITSKILIQDENDNDPIFIAPENTKISIAVNTHDSAVLRVMAVDKDAGDNGRVSYTISSGNEDRYFSIGNETGLVNLIRPLMQPTTLEIKASDHGMPSRTAVINLTLTPYVEQLHDLPRLLLPNPIVRISENLKIGTNIINVAGITPLINGNITFRIQNDIVSDKFNVSNNGLVSLLTPLDREDISNYFVPILAQSNKILDFTTLEIVVLDENDNNPEFKSDSCHTLTIPENKETTVIHSFAATDADENKNSEITYSIINGNIGSKFKLDPVTGILSASSLDRELVPKYVLIISAKDKGHPSRETRCNLTIIVLDVNDNSPIFLHNQYSNSALSSTYMSSKGDGNFENYHMSTFTQGKYTTTISEDIAGGSSIMQIRAIDLDQGLNGKITYSITGESTWLFRVDNLTGIITTAGLLDRECESFYSFLVIASDSGKSEARQTSVPIEIHISDVNDNNPIFEEYPYIVQVPVSTQPGQNILQVKANDEDYGVNREILYAISPHEKNKTKFRIHPSTGMVTILSSLTQENGLVYRLDVTATDKGNPNLSATSLIEFHIGDILESVPLLKFQKECYDIVIPENSTIGTEIIQVTAVRSDGRRQQIVYSIGSGNDYQIFDIHEKTGILRVNNLSNLDTKLCNKMKPNFNSNKNPVTIEKYLSDTIKRKQIIEQVEKGSNYIVTLIAKTVGLYPLQAYAKLIIRISDVNDNAPIFTQSQYSATVLEGNIKGEFVVKLFANDIDQGVNSRLLYHIVDGNPDNAFTINPSYSGIVRTNIVLDREIREKYRLTIIATDQGSPQLTGTTALNIRVIDINDNQPTFPEHKIIYVSEDTIQGTVLTIITANDIDTSPVLMYRFGNISYPSLFSIDRFSGRVVLIGKLDAETRTEYTLQVIVSDEVHETATKLTIEVLDINDNSPYFDQVFYITTLAEEQSNIQKVLIVNATDDDLTEENNKIHYRLHHPEKGFKMEATTGVLIINETALSKPMINEIELAIIAEDSGKPSLSTMCSVIVRFNTLKNGQLGKEYKILIKENVTKGTNLLQISDINLPKNSMISGDDIGLFEISMGKLIVTKSLDREEKDSYIIHVGVKKENSTAGFFIEEDPVMIVINVDDVNDNYPYFFDSVREVTIKEDTPIGYTIANIIARDNDLAGSPAAKIVYDIISGNDGNKFCIDKNSGVLTVNDSLDCDVGLKVYHLVIIACDSDIVVTLCTIMQVHIQLEDVNDNSPTFPVSEYLEFVGENEPIGTVVFIAHASDLDGGVYGKLEYSIISSANNGYSDMDESWKLFSIDSNSGAISTCAIFDYEQRNRYTFTLCATDTGGRTASVRVRIEIDSRDEFYPQFIERMYHFSFKINVRVLPGIIIGHVTATDRDKGVDGRVVYQLTSQHPYFKLNRTTGALIVKQKLTHFDMNTKDSSRLIVSASSGKQGSLSNMTIVEISWLDNDLSLSYDTSVFTAPNISSNMTVTGSNGIADWAFGLLITLFLLIIAFGSFFLYLYIKNRYYQNPRKKSGFGGDNNPTASNSYVDPSAFDTIPIRNITTVSSNENNNIISRNNEDETPCQFIPPKYDEIPPYDVPGQSGIQATSELSGSRQSGSSGRGSAEDDGEDEEIRMINESQHLGDSINDLTVHNTQEYLARLGIVDPPIGISRKLPDTSALDNLQLFENEAEHDADLTTLIYGKISNSSRPTSSLEIPGGPSMNGSLSSIVHSEEELSGSYNWDYLLDWGPQYQPLAHVFSEIARLKDDTASVQSGNSDNNSKLKCLHKEPPPPLLTSVAPRLLNIPVMARGLLPRSPISHDASTFPSAALSPSFSPSLSPLANRSPNISPLVPSTTLRMNQCPPRGISINDTELRI